MKKNDNTEELILQAAEELFLQKGYSATSTTDIARRIGCNQSLIHYYFRTKDALFERILIGKMSYILHHISAPLESDSPFEEKLRNIVSQYFDFLAANRNLPLFLLNEIISNEKNRRFIVEREISNPHISRFFLQFDRCVKQEIEAGRIRSIETIDLMLNIISLVVMSFVSLPFYCDICGNPDAADTYLASRRNEICTLILNGVKSAE